MNTITINGVTFNDFGTNKYSDGMKLISVYPMPNNIIQDVLEGKYPGIYLNPSAPCTSEFFGVFGTEEQYAKFYSRQRKAQIASKLIEMLGWDLDHPQYKEIKEEITANYKDWWNE